MYSLTPANKYYLYQGFIRMNLGINGLYKLIRSEMSQLSPVSGDEVVNQNQSNSRPAHPFTCPVQAGQSFSGSRPSVRPAC